MGPWNLCDLGRLTVQKRPKGTKRIVGPSSDQSCWSVYLPTNNIARTTCNIIGAYIYRPTILHRQRANILHGDGAKCLHSDGAKCCWFWEGQLAVWLLAVGSWLLAAGSCLDNLILLLYWDIRTRNSKVRRDILTHQTDIHKLQIYIWLSLLVNSLFVNHAIGWRILKTEIINKLWKKLEFK